MLDAGYALLDDLQLQTVQDVIEDRVSSIEYQEASATIPPVTGDRQPQTRNRKPDPRLLDNETAIRYLNPAVHGR